MSDKPRIVLGHFRNRSRVFKVAITSVLIIILGVGAISWYRINAVPDNAAFVYDGHAVTVEDLDRRIDTLRALYGVVEPSEPGPKESFRRAAAKSFAVSLILDKAAVVNNVVVTNDQVRGTLDRYIAEQFGGDRAAFVRTIGNVRTSEVEILAEVRRRLEVTHLMSQTVGEVRIEDEQIRTAFEQRREQLGISERRALRNIVVASEADARTVLSELQAGMPFDQVAAKWSLDESTKQTGGVIGELSRQQLEPPVADAAFSVAEGGLYGPVRSQYGFDVGRVDRVLPPVPAVLEQVRDSLRKTLQDEESLRRWQDWLDEQMKGAGVQYADAYRPSDPESAPPPAGNENVQPGGATRPVQDRTPR